MAEKTFSFKIITPTGIMFDGLADMVIFRAATGDMAVLAGHAPIAAMVGNGKARAFTDEEERTFTLNGGLAEVNQAGEFTILTDSATETTKR